MTGKSHTISGYRILFAALSVLCMAVIFSFSCENGTDSSQTSGFFVDFLTSTIIKDYDKLSPSDQADTAARLSHIIRKTAHFSCYLILGVCISLTAGARRFRSPKAAVSLLICFCYACSDEFHQYFVPGREGRFSDVLLDSAGSLTGIVIVVLIRKAAAARKARAGKP